MPLVLPGRVQCSFSPLVNACRQPCLINSPRTSLATHGTLLRLGLYQPTAPKIPISTGARHFYLKIYIYSEIILKIYRQTAARIKGCCLKNNNLGRIGSAPLSRELKLSARQSFGCFAAIQSEITGAIAPDRPIFGDNYRYLRVFVNPPRSFLNPFVYRELRQYFNFKSAGSTPTSGTF